IQHLLRAVHRNAKDRSAALVKTVARIRAASICGAVERPVYVDQAGLGETAIASAAKTVQNFLLAASRLRPASGSRRGYAVDRDLPPSALRARCEPLRSLARRARAALSARVCQHPTGGSPAQRQKKRRKSAPKLDDTARLKRAYSASQSFL